MLAAPPQTDASHKAGAWALAQSCWPTPTSRLSPPTRSRRDPPTPQSVRAPPLSSACSRAERRTAGAQRDHSDDRCGGRRCGRVAGRVGVDRHLRARRGCRGPRTVLRRRAAALQVRAWPARALRSARGACSAMRALPRIPPLVPLRLAAPAVCRDARHRRVAAALDVRITRCGAGALRSQAEVRHAGRGWPGRYNRRSLGGARLDVRGAFRCRPPCAVLGPRAARHALRRAPATRTMATVY